MDNLGLTIPHSAFAKSHHKHYRNIARYLVSDLERNCIAASTAQRVFLQLQKPTTRAPPSSSSFAHIPVFLSNLFFLSPVLYQGRPSRHLGISSKHEAGLTHPQRSRASVGAISRMPAVATPTLRRFFSTHPQPRFRHDGRPRRMPQCCDVAFDHWKE